jgi:GcrA cell cycle regulator
MPWARVGVMDWSAERISDLTRLWREGLTAAEIGRRLGVSKSAVVGKAHRLRLDPRPSPIKRIVHRSSLKLHPWALPATPNVKRPTPPNGASAPDAVRDPLNPRAAVRRAKREDYAGRGLSKATCAWPIGDPREAEFRSCDRRAIRGKPYCAAHCATAYVIARPKAP